MKIPRLTPTTSLRITAFCLIILFILTAWGTVYQIEYGLYAAQKRFFYSFFFLASGFFPLPGAQLILWILAVNLIADLALNFKRRFSKLGIFLIHGGILILLAGAFVTYYTGEESYLPLYEGEKADTSRDYRKWEIAAWKINDSQINDIYAYPVDTLPLDQVVNFPSLNLNLVLRQSLSHASRLPQPREGEPDLARLTERKNPSENLPGVMVHLSLDGEDLGLETLWGADRDPLVLKGKTHDIAMELRRLRYSLPVTLELIDFRREEHQGTDIPKSYESSLIVKEAGVTRKAKVYMNHPLRVANYTFYQASFNEDRRGEQSVFAVVKNTWWILPYLSSGLIAMGLLIHFAGKLFKFWRRRS